MKSGASESIETPRVTLAGFIPQPLEATGSSGWPGSSESSITTRSNSSASWIPSQTACSTSSVSSASANRADTASTPSSMRWCCTVVAVSWAIRRAIAACCVIATSASSSSSLGRRPVSGSSTEITPISSPLASRSGTNSASSAVQASGSSLGSMSGT